MGTLSKSQIAARMLQHCVAPLLHTRPFASSSSFGEHTSPKGAWYVALGKQVSFVSWQLPLDCTVLELEEALEYVASVAKKNVEVTIDGVSDQERIALLPAVRRLAPRVIL